ncbi:MAG: arginine deiminase family protein [Mucilaginibacter sp.]|uniref:arginine deiminase family protein n=1 Tax=Mucilaginibacter sp. TaxID=1882438 RepID=UPI0034E59F81
MLQKDTFQIQVSSEIGDLHRILIHSPDKGLGKVIPSKAQDWLFEDIVHLETIRKKEYDLYVKVLLYFLDPALIQGKIQEIDAKNSTRNFYKPNKTGFYASEKVIELEILLKEILDGQTVRQQLIAAVCATENCNYQQQQTLMDLPSADLATLFISGTLPDGKIFFAPLPNLIFTRDLGTTINNYILLNKPARKARSREALLCKYIFFNHPFFEAYRQNIIEVPQTEEHFLIPEGEIDQQNTLEGGDVMMVSKNHLLIGCGERTTPLAASNVIKLLFEKNVVQKVTVIKIPHKRDFMHLDTVFTQIKKGLWVLLSSLFNPEQNNPQQLPLTHLMDIKKPDRPEIIQFENGRIETPKRYERLEDLLSEISEKELGFKEKTQFIYSGNNIFPHDSREQWTDGCNLLALKEGVVLAYDRNDKTLQAFKQQGFIVIKAADLLKKLERGELQTENISNTIITFPSAELSRARGGFHCMSMPLFRAEL